MADLLQDPQQPFPQLPQTPTGPGMVNGFLKDPRNLMTGLVFLAAALQPRSQGQSTAGKLGQAAVAGLGFRGGLDKGLRNDRIQDEERQARRLQESQQEEHRQVQSRVAQQGVGLQQQQLNQAERLAQERMKHEQELAGTVRPETPEEAKLKLAMASYYNRMPKAGGGDGSGFGGASSQIFEDAFKLQWEQEVKAAAMEGRAPDVTKTIPQLANLASGLALVPQNLQLERGADGRLYVVVPGGADGAPPAGAPAAIPPAPAAEPTGADFSAPPVDPQKFKKITPRGSNAPSADFITEQQLASLNAERLHTFLRDPRLSKEQAVKVRQEIARRRGQREQRYDMGY